VCTKFGQNPLKVVDSRVFTRILRKDGSVTISLRNFVGEGIIIVLGKDKSYFGEKKIQHFFRTPRGTIVVWWF
jgi:hypothetical protein